ncbi:SurA N-terminal domain-containing protein [Heliophilum fasciatum]|uniref:peptidylprolyl isomerase n=1 Tax=Heliophilum fasciatum TaxID=35700 RepID=A0A4V2SWW6_9FIRM|nr:SurA N-terminal domain-containing protein [Heliophilum fasciatum]MCW2278223.1 parvulin-like peptidyl-prolyl isomerase [Heliophilum fasciatum]TCP63956.1 SurA-like protein [Heliophilum fasciatum]
MFEKIKQSKQAQLLLVVVAGILLLGAFAISNGYANDANGNIVARVNGETVTKDDLYATMVKEQGKQALDALIAQKMIDAEAKKQNVTVTDDEIAGKLTEIEASYGGKEAFLQALSLSGLTEEQLKENIARNIRVEKLIAPQIVVTDEEMLNFFNENKEILAQEAAASGAEASTGAKNQEVPAITFEASKEKIKGILFTQKVQEQYESWLSQLYSEYKVETFLN